METVLAVKDELGRIGVCYLLCRLADINNQTLFGAAQQKDWQIRTRPIPFEKSKRHVTKKQRY